MNNYAYVTLLNSDSYLKGVICLNESLKKVKSKYQLYVLITGELSLKSQKILDKYKINIIKVNKKIDVPEWVINRNINENMQHWNNSFDKLLVFELTQFKKIIFLDSDMYVVENIDNLFEKKHMSGVILGESFPDNYYSNWTRTLFSSGLLVIEPKDKLINEFIKYFDKIKNIEGAIGDQQILWEYFNNWSIKKELHLNEKYTVCFEHLDYYRKNLKYDIYNERCENNIKTIHFSAPKPWFLSKQQKIKYIIYYMIRVDFKKVRLLYTYFKILKVIEDNIRKIN